jgi:hypothetical protein
VSSGPSEHVFHLLLYVARGIGRRRGADMNDERCCGEIQRTFAELGYVQ